MHGGPLLSPPTGRPYLRVAVTGWCGGHARPTGAEWLGREEAGRVALALYRKYRPRTSPRSSGRSTSPSRCRRRCAAGGSTTPTCSPARAAAARPRSARILARSLNCEQGPTPEPCGECDSCRALAPDGSGSIDVIEIDAASHGGVDDARELREKAFFAPVQQPLQDLRHRRGAHGLVGRLQRPAQAGRGAAGVRQVRLRDDRAGEGPRHDQVADPPLPVPADPAEACCGRTWSSSAAGRGRHGRAGGLPAGGARRRRQRPGHAVGARPADRRAPARRGSPMRGPSRCSASPTSR